MAQSARSGAAQLPAARAAQAVRIAEQEQAKDATFAALTGKKTVETAVTLLDAEIARLLTENSLVETLTAKQLTDGKENASEALQRGTGAVARDYGYDGPMKSMPVGIAKEIYIQRYIVEPKFDKVLLLSPAVGTKLVDMGVNTGPGRATRTFQQTLNDLNKGDRDYPPVEIDGAMGNRTLTAYSALEKHRGRVKACELTLKLIDGYQTTYYVTLAKNPANASFIVGWLDHRIGNVDAERCSEVVQ